MIRSNKTAPIFIENLFSAKVFIISLMVPIFMFFASNADPVVAIEDLYSIIIGTGFFMVASALIFWAAEVSQKINR